MAVEKGQNVLLQIGDGGGLNLAGLTYSVSALTDGYQVGRATGSFVADGWLPGMVFHGHGFEDNPGDFHGIVSAVAALTLTLTDVLDADGNPLVLIDEAAGANVTLTGERFFTIPGQDDTQKQISASSIDASTKDTGKWGATLSGTNKMTVSVNGKVNWPDVVGVRKILTAMESSGEVWLKLILNEAGDYWYGKFAITQCNVSGAKDGATIYNLSFENKLRPNFVEAA